MDRPKSNLRRFCFKQNSLETIHPQIIEYDAFDSQIGQQFSRDSRLLAYLPTIRQRLHLLKPHPWQILLFATWHPCIQPVRSSRLYIKKYPNIDYQSIDFFGQKVHRKKESVQHSYET